MPSNTDTEMLDSEKAGEKVVKKPAKPVKPAGKEPAEEKRAEPENEKESGEQEKSGDKGGEKSGDKEKQEKKKIPDFSAQEVAMRLPEVELGKDEWQAMAAEQLMGIIAETEDVSMPEKAIEKVPMPADVDEVVGECCGALVSVRRCEAYQAEHPNRGIEGRKERCEGRLHRKMCLYIDKVNKMRDNEIAKLRMGPKEKTPKDLKQLEMDRSMNDFKLKKKARDKAFDEVGKLEDNPGMTDEEHTRRLCQASSKYYAEMIVEEAKKVAKKAVEA